jgi:origin recognition complex subunit 5
MFGVTERVRGAAEDAWKRSRYARREARLKVKNNKDDAVAFERVADFNIDGDHKGCNGTAQFDLHSSRRRLVGIAMNGQLEALISYPGSVPFIHIHHPHHPTTSLDLPSAPHIARLDAIEYHTPRLLYTGILHALGSETEELATWDSFARALRDHLSTSKSKGKGKGKRKADDMENASSSVHNGVANGHEGHEEVEGAVVIITHVERLRTVLGNGWTVMTRLTELVGYFVFQSDLADVQSGANVTLVLCSSAPWEELRPPRGDAPEPVHIFLPAPTKDGPCRAPIPSLLSSSAEVLQALLPASSHPVWSRFLELLLSSLLHLTSSPITELEYIAEALWPLYTSSLPPHLEQDLLGSPYPDPDNPPPALVTNIKLLTDLKHGLAVPLAVAAEDLITRRVGIEEFRKTMRRPVPGTPSRALARASQAGQGLVADLALCGKYLVVAGYCASYNPAKSDQRLFGRIGADGKRRRGGGNRRAGYGRMRVGKVRPQAIEGRLWWTIAEIRCRNACLGQRRSRSTGYWHSSHRFMRNMPRDRRTSCRGRRMAGHRMTGTMDGGRVSRRPREGQNVSGGKSKRGMRCGRTKWITSPCPRGCGVWCVPEEFVDRLGRYADTQIPELESQGLLRRMSPPDRLDNITMRCEVDYEEVKSIAKDLRITLDEYLYEATA